MQLVASLPWSLKPSAAVLVAAYAKPGPLSMHGCASNRDGAADSGIGKVCDEFPKALRND